MLIEQAQHTAMLQSITGKSTDGWIKIQCRETDGGGEKIQGPEVNMSEGEAT